MDWIAIGEKFGLPFLGLAAVAFAAWKIYLRMANALDSNMQRMADLQKESHQESLATQKAYVASLETVVRNSTEAQLKQGEVFRDLVDELRRRPCMSGQWDGSSDRRKS